MSERRIIDVKSLYLDTAKLADLSGYVAKALELAGEGNEVVLTALVWYLLGRHYVHALAFPLAFLLFMIPLPAILLNTITLPLQLLAM